MKTLVQHLNEARIDTLVEEYEKLKEYGFTFVRVTDGKRRAMSRTLKMSSISFEELESKISWGEYNVQSGDIAFDVSALDENRISDLEECINQFLYDANNRHVIARRFGNFIIVAYKQIISKIR